MTAPLTNSQRMRRKMELTSGSLHGAFDGLWTRPDLPEIFPAFLVLLHQVMRASVPLMATAAEVCRPRTDPLSQALTPASRNSASSSLSTTVSRSRPRATGCSGRWTKATMASHDMLRC